MQNTPAHYYDRFDSTKNYEKILFRDGYGMQASEFNELQSASKHRLRGVADALFKDGDIIRDATVIVDATTGVVQAESGALYIAGAVRGLQPKSFTIPTEGTVFIGVRLIQKVISELNDPALYNPALGSRGEGEPGAWRLQVTPEWGHDGEAVNGEFYPVYAVDNGILRAKEAPPTLDAFTQSIARYDRDSTGGGSYIADGLTIRHGHEATGKQEFVVSSGRARVNGYGVTLATDRRIEHVTTPDLRIIDTEVHQATGDASQRIVVAHAPIHEIMTLRCTRRKTVELVHGSYSGALDALPDTSVVSIVTVAQGDTTYSQGTDYKKTGDKVDWSPAGSEPANGSTYSVTYDHMVVLEPANLDKDGFDVLGAVEGTSILVTYKQALPRIDRVCLTAEGLFTWVKGVASEYNPRVPAAPSTVLPLACVYQTWRGMPAVVNDGVRVVPFSHIETINKRLDYLLFEVARQRLESDVFTRESGARVGLFVDPLLDDSMRDAGITQTAAIVDGELTLPITGNATSLAPSVTTPTTLPYTVQVLLEQNLRTGSMNVNPYMAFEPLPAEVTISPDKDFWTETTTEWTSPATKVFENGWGNRSSTTVSTSSNLVGTTTESMEFLRPISVAFTLTGFGAGEELETVLFDGIAVSVTASEGV